MAPGQCRKAGVRGKLSKKHQMEDVSGYRSFMSMLEQGSAVLIY